MANTIQFLGSGNGFLYITQADGTTILSNILNTPGGRDTILQDALSAGPVTGERLSQGKVKIDVGAGTVTTCTVNAVDVMGAAAATGATPQLIAIDLANKINTQISVPEYTAYVIDDTVYIVAAAGTGSTPNGFVVATGVTAPTTTTNTDMANGSPASGLYDATMGRRYFINNDLLVGGEGDLTGAVEITKYIVNHPLNGPANIQNITIVAGTAVVDRQSAITIVAFDTEGGAATDDLDTISTDGVQDGDLLICSGTSAGRVVTFKTGTGNLTLAFGVDYASGNLAKILTLRYATKLGGATLNGWFAVANSGIPPTVTNQYASAIAIAKQGREALTLVNTGTLNSDIGKTGSAYWISINDPTVLIGNVIYQPDPAPTFPYLDGMEVVYDYRSLAVTGGVNTITIGDILLTDEQATTGNVTVWGKFKTGTWFYFLLAKTEGIDILDKVLAAATYELLLGNPAADGYTLQSTAAGVRSWGPNTANEVLYNVTANNGTAADIILNVLKTYTMPGSTMVLDDDIVYVRGVFQTAATADAKTIEVYFGVTNVATITGTFNAQTIIVEGEINRIDVNNQSASFTITEYDTATGAWVSENAFYTLPGENLAANVNIEFTGTNGAANLNDIISRQASVKIFGKRNV